MCAYTDSKVLRYLISGTPYRSLIRRIAMEVYGMVDSPTANRGCVPASSTSVRAPLRARHAARVEPASPEPITTTSNDPLCAAAPSIMGSLFIGFTSASERVAAYRSRASAREGA